MKFGTSFFNARVLKKDIARFAPAWALYFTGALLVMLGRLSGEDSRDIAEVLGITIGPLSIINLAYALLCAQLLFGDLFNARLCNALHAMPLRREGWFLTHVTSGILFSVVPNLVVSLCMMPSLQEYWYVSLIWLGGMTLSYLFFFGCAVLSAMCTGNRFAMAVVYGIINFLSIILLWILQYLYEPQLYGIAINPDPFRFFSPVCQMCSREWRYLTASVTPGYLRDVPSGWPYLIGIAVVGVAFLVLALVLYRRRKLEYAGDFLTVKPLNPVFLILYTLTAGLVVYLFNEVFGISGGMLLLAVGIAAGYITGQMLLKRTVKVFKLRTFAGLAIIAVVLFGSLALTAMDVFGVARWTPSAGDVQSARICSSYSDTESYTATDPAEIAGLTDLHNDIIAGKNDEDRLYSPINLEYTLKDGRTVTRCYDNVSLSVSDDLRHYLSKPEYVLEYTDYEQFRESITYVSFVYEGSTMFYADDARELVDAIKADCEAGHMAQDWGLHTEKDVTLVEIFMSSTESDEVYQDYRNVTVWENCENTLAWMDAHSISYSTADDTVSD